MISWRLWQALKYPPEDHPLYQHILAANIHTVRVPKRKAKPGEQPSDEFPFGGESPAQPKRIVVSQPSKSSRNAVYKVLALLGLTWFCCCSGGFFFTFPLLLLLLAAGTLYGLYTAVRISGNIAEEHDRGRAELLSLTPSGTLGFSWAAVMGFLHRNMTFARLRRWIPIIGIALSLLTLDALVFLSLKLVVVYTRTYQGGSTLTYPNPNDRILEQIVALFYIIAITAAFYVDFFQSVIAGILIAIVTPTYGRNRFETQALTLGGFLGVQLVTYLSTLLIGFAVLPRIFQLLAINGWVAEVILIGLQLGVFVLVRETFITWLWQFAQQRLNIGVGELDLITPKAKREASVV